MSMPKILNEKVRIDEKFVSCGCGEFPKFQSRFTLSAPASRRAFITSAVGVNYDQHTMAASSHMWKEEIFTLAVVRCL
jgi:hypothetical protein